MKSNKKQFRELKDVMLGGAVVGQTATLFTNPGHPGQTAGGLVGVAVAGATANVAFDIVSGRKTKRKRR